MSLLLIISNNAGGSVGGGTPPPEPQPYLLMREIITSTLPMNETAVFSDGGSNEFDVVELPGGNTGIVWDARTKIDYVEVPNSAAIQAALSGKTNIRTTTLSYPSHIIEAGVYYLYQHNSSDETTVSQGADEVAAGAASQTVLLTGVSDFKVVKAPDGVFWGVGHVSGKSKIWTASSPTGPFTDHGFVFNDPNLDLYQPPYALNQADQHLVFDYDDQPMLMFNAFTAGRTGTPQRSHSSVVMIDPATKRALHTPIEIIDQLSRTFHTELPGNPSAFCYNAVYVPWLHEVWYSLSDGSIGSPQPGYLACYAVDGDGDYTLPTNELLWITEDSTKERVSNRSYRETTGGFYDLLNRSFLLENDITCSFVCNTLPLSGEGLIFTIGSRSANHICAVVDSAGVLKVKWYTGTSGEHTVDTITTGEEVELTILIRLSLGFLALTINGVSVGTIPGNFTGLDTYSVYNEETDVEPAGSQFTGIVRSLIVTNESAGDFIPTS